MIENYLLEELVTFQRMGTLKKTAAHLAVTQPTVTRGMQKLEDGLGVKLFDRHPNRLELTAAGELAAKEAAAVLRRQELMVNRVQNFVAQNQALTIGAVVPGPLIILKRLAGAPLFNHQVDERLVEPERVPEELTDDRLGMVFTTNVTAADPSYHPVPANNRVERSIKGPKAELTIYVTVKRQRQTQVQPLVDRLKAAWAKLPTTPTTGGTNVLK